MQPLGALPLAQPAPWPSRASDAQPAPCPSRTDPGSQPRPRRRYRRKSLGVHIADGNTWFAGVQTFAQGAVAGCAHLAAGLARWPALSPLVRVLQPMADFLNGRPAVVSATARTAGATTSTTAGASAAATAGSVVGGLGRLIGRLAPVFNVLASTWDTIKALAEDDPERKPASVANAVLSWSCTLMVLGALALGATPVGIGLAIGGTGLAGAQLVDNLFFGGGGTRAIGNALFR